MAVIVVGEGEGERESEREGGREGQNVCSLLCIIDYFEYCHLLSFMFGWFIYL